MFVNVMFFGLGFGCKSKFDYCVEVVFLFCELKCFVYVIWICEDDMSYDYYYVILVVYCEVVIGNEGFLEVWL